MSVEDDILADQLVALGREQDDIARGADLAGLAIPDDLIGGEIIALARHAYFAGRGDHVGIAVVGDAVGAEIDDWFGGLA